uniref:Calcium-binding mitochondrial carrier protein SCaMC-3-like n=1 Tax=Sinocyclocheilus rhinocerous TaxID=307959 RepID=A0A673GJM0_9TELE
MWRARCQDSGVDPERERLWAELFAQLDLNKDGRIDVNELRIGLAARGMSWSSVEEQIVRAGDVNHDGQLDFEEFVEYLRSHEKRLRLMFRSLDRNNDGELDVAEIQQSLHNLGVDVTLEQAAKILQSMDKDHSMTIDWLEWRDHFLFNPLHNMEEIAQYWKHSVMLDIGELLTVPDEFSEKEKQSGFVWRQLMAGAVAGSVSRTGTAPLDRLKVFLQVHGQSSDKGNVWRGLRAMVKEGGLTALWRGNGINVLKIAPETAIKFLAYEQIKRLMRGSKEGGTLKVQERFVAGSLAGAMAQTVIYPMEVLKTRLTLRKTGQYSSVADCAKQILQKEGVLAFYKGYLPNMLGIIPYAGIDLAIYETLKNGWLQRHAEGSPDPGVLVLVGCGTVSSTCGQLASYPLALIRTRMQAQGETHTQNQTRAILQKEGVLAFYKGYLPNMLGIIPYAGIDLAIYEVCVCVMRRIPS